MTKKINNNPSYRNALYMMLTRSFLKSYLLINEESNQDLLPLIENGLENINRTGTLIIKEPSEEEKQRIKTTINYEEIEKPFYDSVHDLFDNMDIERKYRKQLYEIIKQLSSDGFDKEKITSVIDVNIPFLQGDE